MRFLSTGTFGRTWANFLTAHNGEAELLWHLSLTDVQALFSIVKN
ncbi:MAG: hypothetical protein V7L11_14520 [Nostoc sp.]